MLAYEVRELLRNIVCHVGGQLLYVLRRGVYLKDVLYLDYHLSAAIIFNRPTRWVVNRTDIVFLLVLIDVLTCLIQMIGVLRKSRFLVLLLQSILRLFDLCLVHRRPLCQVVKQISRSCEHLLPIKQYKNCFGKLRLDCPKQ